MFVPFFPLLGLSDHLMLLDPTIVFTPLTCGLVLLASLCGLGIGVLLARTREIPKRLRRATQRRLRFQKPPSLLQSIKGLLSYIIDKRRVRHETFLHQISLKYIPFL
jgi:hypothetical protein